MQNSLVTRLWLFFIARLFPNLLPHVNNLFFLHKKLVFQVLSRPSAFFSFKFFINWYWHLFVQMNSVGILWVLIFWQREMRSPLSPYLILVSTESMILCSIMQPNNQTFRPDSNNVVGVAPILCSMNEWVGLVKEWLESYIMSADFRFCDLLHPCTASGINVHTD